MPKHAHSFSATTSTATLKGGFSAMAYVGYTASGVMSYKLSNPNIGVGAYGDVIRSRDL